MSWFVVVGIGGEYVKNSLTNRSVIEKFIYFGVSVLFMARKLTGAELAAVEAAALEKEKELHK